MGLSNFPSPSEGVLPFIVMNAVMSVALVKYLFRAMLQVFGVIDKDSRSFMDPEYEESCFEEMSKARRVLITRYGENRDVGECCVCLSGFKAEEEVSELSCKHFFHKACLDRWFENLHVTCPICRSVN